MGKKAILVAVSLMADHISPAQFCPRAPDLRVSAVTLADSPFRIFQNTNRLEVQVRNAPEAESNAGSFFVTLDVCALSAPAKCERLGTAVYNDAAGIAPGAAVTLPVNNTPSVPLLPGDKYRIVATADSNGHGGRVQ